MPISFDLSNASVNQIGRSMQNAIGPLLTGQDRLLSELSEVNRRLQSFADLLLIEIVDAMTGIRVTALKVYETNPDLLRNMQITREATAYLAYNLMVDIEKLLKWRLGQISARLDTLHQDLVAIGFDIVVIGNHLSLLLQAILAQIVQGLNLFGVIYIIIDAGSLGDIIAFVERLVASLNSLNLITLYLLPNLTALLQALTQIAALFTTADWERILIIATGLEVVNIFVERLATAIHSLNVDVLRLLPNLTSLVETLAVLVLMISHFSSEQITNIAAAFASLGGFVQALGTALSSLSADVLEMLPNLDSFINTLSRLLTTAADLDIEDELTPLTNFVTALGRAISSIGAETMALVPNLNDLVETLRRLVVSIGDLSILDFSVDDVLDALSKFVRTLGTAISSLDTDVLGMLPNLNNFVETLNRLVTAIGNLGLIDQLLGVPLVLKALAGFVRDLGTALNAFTTSALNALPALGQLMSGFASLLATLGELSLLDLPKIWLGLQLLLDFIEQIGTTLDAFSARALAALPSLALLIDGLARLVEIVSTLRGAAGLAALTGFIITLGVVLERVAGPLSDLANILDKIQSVLDLLGGLFGAGGGPSAPGGGGGPIPVNLPAGGTPSPMFAGLSLPAGPPFGALPSPSALGPTFGPGGPTAQPAALPGVGGVPGAGEATPAGGGPPLPTGAGGPVDQSVTLTGVTININAERLEADAADILSDEIVQQLRAKLDSLRSDQDRRLGQPTAAAV